MIRLFLVVLCVWMFEARKELLGILLVVGIMHAVPALHRAGLTDYAFVVFLFGMTAATLMTGRLYTIARKAGK